MGEKRYYWLKLKEGFFKQIHIKRLRNIAGGDTYTIIYQKMMLASLNNGGRIIYDNIKSKEEFVEVLAMDIDEKLDNIKIALSFLLANKLVEHEKDNELLLNEAAECIESEQTSASRVRKYREKHKALQCNDDVTGLLQGGNKKVTIDIDIDKDIDKDIEDVVTNVHQEHVQMSGQMSQDTKVAYASHIRMTEENYNHLLELVNGNKIFLKEIVYDCNEWRKTHKPKSKNPNDYMFVKNWLKKELDKVPAAKPIQEEQPVLSAEQKRKAYLDSLPPEIRANLDQFK